MNFKSKIVAGVLLTASLAISSSSFSQTSTQTSNSGVYLIAGIAHDFNFKINKTLIDLGGKKIPDILTGVKIGLYYDIKKVALSLETGVETMANSKTTMVGVPSSLSAGYKWVLPKNHNLIFAGNISYTVYNVTAYIEKGGLDIQNATLINPRVFGLQLHQLQAGAKITWRSKYCHFGIGYDIGCIPTTWKSTTVHIANSPKERIDRVHLDFGAVIIKY
jgi:hypothetical protein